MKRRIKLAAVTTIVLTLLQVIVGVLILPAQPVPPGAFAWGLGSNALTAWVVTSLAAGVVVGGARRAAVLFLVLFGIPANYLAEAFFFDLGLRPTLLRLYGFNLIVAAAVAGVVSWRGEAPTRERRRRWLTVAIWMRFPQVSSKMAVVTVLIASGSWVKRDVRSFGVVLRPHEVQGHVRPVADHPTVVGNRRNVEERPLGQLDDRAVVEGGGRYPGENHADVLHRAACRADRGPDVLRPFPARLVRRPPDNSRTDAHDLEATLLEDPHLVRRLEPLQHGSNRFRTHLSPRPSSRCSWFLSGGRRLLPLWCGVKRAESRGPRDFPIDRRVREDWWG